MLCIYNRTCPINCTPAVTLNRLKHIAALMHYMICREGLQITSIMPLHNICYARPLGHGGSHFTLKDGRNDCTCSHNHITHQPLPQTTSPWRQSPCNKQYERRYCSCYLYCVACLLYSRLLGNGGSPCITKRRRK